MPTAKRTISYVDNDDFLPLLKKLAEREAEPGEAPNVSRILRRFIREGLVGAGMLKGRGTGHGARDTGNTGQGTQKGGAN